MVINYDLTVVETRDLILVSSQHEVREMMPEDLTDHASSVPHDRIHDIEHKIDLRVRKNVLIPRWVSRYEYMENIPGMITVLILCSFSGIR